MHRTMAWLAAGLIGLFLATAARAVPVETTTALNLRAGPGVAYPVVAIMPAGQRVDLRGCEGTWCFVVYRGALGWASGRYLARVPFRPQTGVRVPFLDWLSPEPARPRYEAPPPPSGLVPPRVIEGPTPRAAPRSAPEPAQARPQRAPAQEDGAAARGGGLLREAAPVVNVPRPDAEPAPPTADARAGDGAGSAASEPAADSEPGGEAPNDETLRRREGAGGTTGSEV
ncbi:MAG: SH3 domain-containing protein [Salinarimonas sp.]